MKKIIICCLCLSMLCGLSACANQGAQDDDFASVKVVNVSEEEIYGIGYSYYVDGELMNSGGVCNADNSAIKKGEEFVFTDIPESEEFTMELSVTDESGNEYSCFSAIDIKNGEQYMIQISGDCVNGFVARIVEKN